MNFEAPLCSNRPSVLREAALPKAKTAHLQQLRAGRGDALHAGNDRVVDSLDATVRAAESGLV